MPANTSLAGASAAFISFDPDGTPNPNGAIGAIEINGAVQGDSTFAVPGASGCTDDNQVNALLGLPSPSGANNLVLLDASSNLALPNAGQNGVQWAADWHTAFGAPRQHDHDDDQHHTTTTLVARSLAGWGRPPTRPLLCTEQCGSPPTGGDPHSCGAVRLQPRQRHPRTLRVRTARELTLRDFSH